jgi:hypothetical protein
LDEGVIGEMGGEPERHGGRKRRIRAYAFRNCWGSSLKKRKRMDEVRIFHHGARG